MSREYLHVNKEVLTVSARKGTDICEFPHRRFLHKRCPSYDISIFVDICMYIKRLEVCALARAQTYKRLHTRCVHIQKYL